MRESLQSALRILGSIASCQSEERASSHVLIVGRESKGGRVHCPSSFGAEEEQHFASLTASISENRRAIVLRCNPTIRKIQEGRVNYPSGFEADGRQRAANLSKV